MKKPTRTDPFRWISIDVPHEPLRVHGVFYWNAIEKNGRFDR